MPALRSSLPMASLLLFFTIVFPASAWAAPGGANSARIVEIIPDYIDNQITITGNGLSDGLNTPTIALGGFMLTVTSHDANTIVANANLEMFVPGDYQLVVDPNYSGAKSLERLLTLGAPLAGQSCATGYTVIGFDSSGAIVCGSVVDLDADGVNEFNLVVALDMCPAGETGWVSDPSTDNDADGCRDSTEDLDDDNDGVADEFDNCPLTYNPGQEDVIIPGGPGDACDPNV